MPFALDTKLLGPGWPLAERPQVEGTRLVRSSTKCRCSGASQYGFIHSSIEHELSGGTKHVDWTTKRHYESKIALVY